MKSFYIIMSGELSASEPGLSKAGRLQACLLKNEFRTLPLCALLSENSAGARETAAFLSEYCPTLPPPYSLSGLLAALSLPEGGSGAFVCSRDAMESLLPALTDAAGPVSQDDLSPCCALRLCLGDKPELCLLPLKRELNSRICLEFLTALSVPDRLRRHLIAVRDKALELARALRGGGLELDEALIQNAALLHDICRQEKNHAEAGAELIGKLGFHREAEIIRRHHDPVSSEISEAAVVYLADKLIMEDRPVSLKQRFEGSREKCRSPQALEAWQRRYSQALEILSAVNAVTGGREE